MNNGPVAFVGVLSPVEDRHDNAAFSQAGATFQESLVGAILGAGVNVEKVFAQRPVPSFPRSRKLFFGIRRGCLESRPITFLPFVNLGAIKAATSGVALAFLLLRWGYRNRRTDGKLILLYNLTSPPGLASVLAGRLTGARTVAVVADVQVPGSGSLAKSLLRQVEYRLQAFTMARCDGLVVLTKRMSSDFAPHVPAVLVEGAVPPQLLSGYPAYSEQTSPDSTTSDRPILMFAGELSALKGVPALLDAFARIRDADMELWITGRGPEQARVEAAALADGRIRYWGYPAYSELLSLYRRATLLVNPHSVTHMSARYLFPSKLIEYFATGVPVLTTTSTPEVMDIYGSFAFVVPGDSADALEIAIRYVLSLPRSELRAKGIAARAFVLRDKTWEAQGRRVAAFMSEVACRVP